MSLILMRTVRNPHIRSFRTFARLYGNILLGDRVVSFCSLVQALAPHAEQYILIADSSMFVERLQGTVPVLIEPVSSPGEGASQ